MKMILYVALGGAAGAVGRYFVAMQAIRIFGPQLPVGTFVINVMGSFALGLLVELLALRITLTPEVRSLLVIGLLGGFTTFSAFSLDLSLMIERNEWLGAVSYALASVILSVGALFLGLWIGRVYFS